MQELLHETGCDKYCAFLTGKDNFRKKINLEYKANRKDQEPPRWLQECREFLVSEWNCIVTNECEADDYLGMYQTEDTIIASLDKDLLMIPGWHFSWAIGGANWTREAEKTYTTPVDGLRYFYKQMLIGDVSDNITGVVGIGKVKAAKYIDNLETEEEMIETVFSLYKEDAARFLMNAQCLWILQKEGETWAHRVNPLILPDLLKQEREVILGSMIFSTEMPHDIRITEAKASVQNSEIPMSEPACFELP